MTLKHQIVEEACNSISAGNISNAKNIIREKYPFVPLSNAGRNYTNHEKTRVFLKDGFIDRYSGEKLIFPPVLRLMSALMPVEFPFHNNWKMSECHLGYWQLLPTVDHIIPVSRGGVDELENWVCTSQLKNSAKSNWLLNELGWQLHDPGELGDWDGMINWYISYSAKNPEILVDKYLNSWHKAAIQATI
jgi:hypothetical protein